MKTIKFDNYEIRTKVNKPAKSNYNLYVSVFKDKDKMPEFGAHFKETTTDRELLEWAFETIDKPNDLGL